MGEFQDMGPGSQFYMAWEGFFSHDSPHFVDVGQGVKVFVVVVVEGAF